MSPRMPWEVESAELLNQLNGMARSQSPRESRSRPRSARSALQQRGRRDVLQDAIRRFNDETCILELLERRLGQGRLKRMASTNGGEWAGPCPLCGGEDRFRVWPRPRDGKPGAWCRQCRVSGDVLAWAVRLAGRDPRTSGATAETLRDHGLI